MINLAENGVRCDCGSSALGPQERSPGELCICAACGRIQRVGVAVEAVPWQTAQAELNGEELARFEWLRFGVRPEHLRDRDAEVSPRSVDWRRAGLSLAVSFTLALACARVLS